MAAELILLAVLAAAIQETPPFEAFPVFVWRQDFQGEELPARIFAPFGGVNVEGDGSVPRIEGQEAPPHFYVGHAPGREEFHLRRSDPWYDAMWQRFYEEREEEKLIRQPCLSDPKTRASLLERLEKSMAARGGDWGSAVSLGDEIGLTPAGDPLDLCRGESCEAQAPAGGTSTDAVRRAWLEEDISAIGPWLARRRFHAGVVHQVAEAVAERVREITPLAPRALFGVKTQTAFGGVDIRRALEFVEWIEPYGDTVTRELCFTLRRPGQRVFATLFPANDRPERAALRLAEHVLRGGDGAVIWSDRHLARSPAYLERLARAVRETRELRVRLRELCGEDWAPQTSGWAVIEDADAVAVSFLRDSLGDGPTWPRRFAGYQVEHGTREVAVSRWVEALEEHGRLPGAMTLGVLHADEGSAMTQRFPVLLLVEQAVLSEKEEHRLERHLESGGVLVVQGHFAEFTREGLARKSPVEEWQAQFEGRVLIGPESLEDVGSRVEQASGVAGLEVPVLRAKGGGVLCAVKELTDGRRIVGLLPRPESDEEKVARVQLELELKKGWRIQEWITDVVTLREDDAETESESLHVVLGPAEALYVVIERGE